MTSGFEPSNKLERSPAPLRPPGVPVVQNLSTLERVREEKERRKQDAEETYRQLLQSARNEFAEMRRRLLATDRVRVGARRSSE